MQFLLNIVIFPACYVRKNPVGRIDDIFKEKNTPLQQKNIRNTRSKTRKAK